MFALNLLLVRRGVSEDYSNQGTNGTSMERVTGEIDRFRDAKFSCAASGLKQFSVASRQRGAARRAVSRHRGTSRLVEGKLWKLRLQVELDSSWKVQPAGRVAAAAKYYNAQCFKRQSSRLSLLERAFRCPPKKSHRFRGTKDTDRRSFVEKHLLLERRASNYEN